MLDHSLALHGIPGLPSASATAEADFFLGFISHTGRLLSPYDFQYYLTSSTTAVQGMNMISVDRERSAADKSVLLRFVRAVCGAYGKYKRQRVCMSGFMSDFARQGYEAKRRHVCPIGAKGPRPKESKRDQSWCSNNMQVCSAPQLSRVKLLGRAKSRALTRSGFCSPSG